jgi:hypothetical protein
MISISQTDTYPLVAGQVTLLADPITRASSCRIEKIDMNGSIDLIYDTFPT